MAHAVKNLYPDTQVTIGPVVENGFIMIILEKNHFLQMIYKN